MTWLEYVENAERTANRGPEDTQHRRFDMCALGLVGEAGEIADGLKKCIFHDHEFNRDAALKKLGDLLWYVAIAANTADIDLGYLWNDLPQGVEIEGSPMPAVSPAIVLAFNASEAALTLNGLSYDSPLPGSARSEIRAKLHPVLAMIALVAQMFESSLEAVAESNIQKLRQRYPEGFTSEHSIHRTV